MKSAANSSLKRLTRVLILGNVLLVLALGSACSNENPTETTVRSEPAAQAAPAEPKVIKVVPGSEAALTFDRPRQACIVSLRGDPEGETISCDAAVSFFVSDKSVARGSVIHVKTTDGTNDKKYYEVTNALKEAGFVLQPVVTVGFIEGVDIEAPYGRGIEYNDTAKEVQTIDIGDAASVTIRCYCQSHRVENHFESRPLVLDITGTYSIGGYHGSAEDAGAKPIPAKALQFSVSREGSVLLLESPEWEYIHHSFLIDDLVVRSALPVHFEHLTYRQLYDRKNKQPGP